MLALSVWPGMGMGTTLLDMERRELVAVNGERRRVTSRYRFRALACLYACRGRLVGRDTLIRAVYAEEVADLGENFIAADFHAPLRKVMSGVRIMLRTAGRPDDALVCLPGEGYLLDDRLLQEVI